MNRNSTRAIAYGLLLASILLFVYKQFLHEEQASDKHEVKAGYIEIEKSEYETLKSDIKHWKSQYDALVAEQKEAENKKIEEKADEQETGQQETKEATPVHYILTIHAGMSSNDISKQLVEVDIIDNAKEFNDYLANQDLQRYIQVGTYELHTAMEIEEIANIITKKKAGS